MTKKSKKLERCIKKLKKDKRSEVNPFAVCKASINKKKKVKSKKRQWGFY